MKRARFAPAAECDLNAVWRYVARKEHADCADDVCDYIRDKIELVLQQPLLGELIAGRNELRRTFATPYVIYYRDKPDEVLIVRILHGSRDHGPLLEDDE